MFHCDGQPCVSVGHLVVFFQTPFTEVTVTEQNLTNLYHVFGTQPCVFDIERDLKMDMKSREFPPLTRRVKNCLFLVFPDLRKETQHRQVEEKIVNYECPLLKIW